jgi:hypothetical protein
MWAPPPADERAAAITHQPAKFAVPVSEVGAAVVSGDSSEFSAQASELE